VGAPAEERIEFPSPYLVTAKEQQPLRGSPRQLAELNDAVKPRLAAVYKRCAPLLTKQGQQIVDRAAERALSAGAAACRR